MEKKSGRKGALDANQVTSSLAFFLRNSAVSLVICGLWAIMGATTAADAQDVAAPVEAVTVTGSRTITNGAEAPTPVTVLTADNLQNAAPTTLAEGLNQLPQFAGSLQGNSAAFSRSTVGNGENILALRGLGAQRTLVLLDGRRFIPSNFIGTVDVNDFPSQLVQRVDVVTGGASAQYGSDAVAGVVNFILDTKFEGFKGTLSSGQSFRNDFDNYKAGLAVGQSFMGGRLHVIGSVDFYQLNNPGRNFANGRAWMQTIGTTVTNPAAGALPLRFRVSDGRMSNASTGGLITGPAPLTGIQFGTGGTILQHDYGTLASGQWQQGGNSTAENLKYGVGAYQKPLLTGFLHAEYDVTPDLTVFAETTRTFQQLGYWEYDQYHDATAGNGLTIFSDNAYLPTSIKNIMAANKITSFSMGRIDDDGGPGLFVNSVQNVESYTLGAHGKALGFDFNAYATHGYSAYKVNNQGTIEQRYFAAIDTVIDPATGQPACRSTLLFGLNPGCVPFNPFGNGSPSTAARLYTTGLGWRKDDYHQDAAGFDVRRDLGALWSGVDPITIASGFEWRTEGLVRTVDPISPTVIDFTGVRGGPAQESGRLGGWQTQSDQPYSGHYSVEEGFLEANVPLLKDTDLVHSLDLNAAGRLTNYSTSGLVETWKVGLVYKPISDLTVRATQSVDIRAPNVTELFGAGSAVGGSGGSSTLDPITKVTVLFVGFNNAGNPSLKPETARTETVGLVYQPEWLPGFNSSIDYYNIHITQALGVEGQQNVLNECLLQQLPTACAQIISISKTNPEVAIWRQVYQNLNSAKTSGVDVEMNYSTDLLGGNFTVRSITNYLEEISTTAVGAAPIDLAGQYNRPKWREVMQLNYSMDGWGLFAQARYMGSGNLSNIFVEGKDIDSNHVKPIVYTDMTLSKDVLIGETAYHFFLTINNLLDQDPVATPVANAVSQGNDFTYYDQIGRRFEAGVKFNF